MMKHLKNNEATNISENKEEEYLCQIINLNLIFNIKTDQVLDSFCKATEKDDDIPRDLSYLLESNHSNIGEENSQYDLKSTYYKRNKEMHKHCLYNPLQTVPRKL